MRLHSFKMQEDVVIRNGAANDRIAMTDGTESCVPCTSLTHSTSKFNVKEEVESGHNWDEHNLPILQVEVVFSYP